MFEALIGRAQDIDFNVAALQQLGAELPPDDGALNELLAEAVARRRSVAFTAIALAALAAGRPVDARHLAGGMSLLDDLDDLLVVAGHASGDVAASLLAAVRTGHSSWEREAIALFIAAWWSREHGRPWPDGLVQHARRLARKTLGPETMCVLVAVADLVGDEALSAAIAPFASPAAHKAAGHMAESMIEVASGPILAGIPEAPEPHVLSGYTVRRAVPRVGRNDPCPCGSGKKYKHCCAERDQERLRDSSEIAGVTRSELRERPEGHLTIERLIDMRSHEVARLDPTKVHQNLHAHIADRLILFDEHDALAVFFDRLAAQAPLTPEMDELLVHAADNAAKAGRKDIVERLLAVHATAGGGSRARPGLLPRIMMLQQPLGEALTMIEEEARRVIDEPEREGGPAGIAYDLLAGPTPALGILVARGAIATASWLSREVLLDELQETRDRLGLPPDDPIEDVMPLLGAAEVAELASDEELAQEHARLEEKTAEIGELRREVARLRKELEARERAAGKAPPSPAKATGTARPAATAPPASQAAGADEARLAELRERVATLRAALIERHAERNALRHEVEQLRAESQVLAARTSGDERPVAGDDDEALLLPDEDTGVQPPRVPVFAPAAREALAALPQRVARAAIEEAGRLAAGAGAAFRGARRLRLNRDLWRQRVSGAYRLLFRLHPTELELLALVHRHDLERTARTLAKSLPPAGERR